MNPDPDLFFPMSEFYEASGAPLPQVVRVEGRDVPEPYRSLLVHNRDLTPTLADAWQRTMRLRILKRIVTDDVVAREIVLDVENSERTAVYAAIKIFLDRFPSEARRLILEGKQPFGSILQGQGIDHFSRPQSFFHVAADNVINRALGLTGEFVLYGRRSALWKSPGIALAQVLEILPPWHPPGLFNRCPGPGSERSKAVLVTGSR